MMNKKLSIILRWAILILVLVVTYLPLALIVAYSFSSARDIGGEGEFTTSLYTALFDDESLMSAVVNTLIIGLCSATLATAIGTFSSVGNTLYEEGEKARKLHFADYRSKRGNSNRNWIFPVVAIFKKRPKFAVN